MLRLCHFVKNYTKPSVLMCLLYTSCTLHDPTSIKFLSCLNKVYDDDECYKVPDHFCTIKCLDAYCIYSGPFQDAKFDSLLRQTSHLLLTETLKKMKTSFWNCELAFKPSPFLGLLPYNKYVTLTNLRGMVSHQRGTQSTVL